MEATSVIKDTVIEYVLVWFEPCSKVESYCVNVRCSKVQYDTSGYYVVGILLLSVVVSS